MSEGVLTRWRNESEQNLPEDGDEVHDVVHAGGKILLAALFIVPFFAYRGSKEPHERGKWRHRKL